MPQESVHLEPVTVWGSPGVLNGVSAGEGASPCAILANLPQTEQFWLLCSRSNPGWAAGASVEWFHDPNKSL